MVVVTDPGLLRQAGYKLTNHMPLATALRGAHKATDDAGIFFSRWVVVDQHCVLWSGNEAIIASVAWCQGGRDH